MFSFNKNDRLEPQHYQSVQKIFQNERARVIGHRNDIVVCLFVLLKISFDPVRVYEIHEHIKINVNVSLERCKKQYIRYISKDLQEVKQFYVNDESKRKLIYLPLSIRLVRTGEEACV